jgi:hypothetical protein
LGGSSTAWLYATTASDQLALFDITETDPTKAVVIDTALLSLPESTSGVFAFGVGVLQHTREHYVYVVASSLDGKIAGLFPFWSTGSKLEPLTFVFARHLETQAQAAYITMDVKRQHLFAAYSTPVRAWPCLTSRHRPRLGSQRGESLMVWSFRL